MFNLVFYWFFFYFLQIFSCDNLTLFNNYELYPKTSKSSINLYAYNLNKVCRISNKAYCFYGTIEDPYSFIKSGDNLLFFGSNYTKILNCLNFKGYSYIFFKNNDYPFSIHVIKNRLEKTLDLEINIQNLYFDHFTSNLIAISDRNLVYNVNMHLLEKMWSSDTNKINFTINSSLLTSLNLHIPDYKDFIIFNSTTFFISGNENSLYSLEKTSSTFISRKIVNSYKSPNFLYIPFPHFQQLFPEFDEKQIEFVAISYNNPYLIHFPPPPKVENNPYLNFLIYIVSITIFLILIRIIFTRISKIRKYRENVHFELADFNSNRTFP